MNKHANCHVMKFTDNLIYKVNSCTAGFVLTRSQSAGDVPLYKPTRVPGHAMLIILIMCYHRTT